MRPSGFADNAASGRVALALSLVLAVAVACDGEMAPEAEAEPELEPTWSEREPFPDRRTEVSGATDGRHVYVIGGFRDPALGFGAPRTMWRFDPEADSWDDSGEIPEGLHHAPFAYLDGSLYILGGFRETSFDPIDDVRIYDLATGEWSDGAPMPTARGAPGWAVLDGRIHVIGGTMDPEGDLPPGGEVAPDGSTNVHESYDPATDSWETHAPMPTPRNHLGAATLDGRIHAVLGRAEGDFTLTVHEIYDPAAGEWTTGPDVPTGRSGVAVVEHGGWLYAFGGERLDEPNDRTFDDAERYDPGAEVWEQLAPMPTAWHGLAAAPVGNAIYVISGGPGPGGTFGDENERLEIP